MSLDELKLKIKQTPISSILERYLPLKREGKKYKCCCPFHDDKDPSMSISDEKNMYFCFPCNEGGDIIEFVKRYKNLDFIEALKDISSAMGLRYEDYVTQSNYPTQKKKALELLKKAADLYSSETVLKNAEAFERFLTERKITKETATKYALGFSPKGNPILSMIREIPPSDERVYLLELAKEIGLIGKNDYDEYYDFFRDRIMFPIKDHLGQIVGFSARATNLEDEKRAKYINSKNSFIFNKSEILFGLAQNEISKTGSLIIVEGQMDQLTLFQSGIENAVALLGTAVSEENLKRIMGLASHIYISFDSDKAGQNASLRLNNGLLAHKIIPYYLDLRPSKDADEFIKTFGLAALSDRLNTAKPYIDYLIDRIIEDNIDFNSKVHHRLEKLKTIFLTIAPLGSTLDSHERILDAAKRLGILSPSEEILANFKASFDEI